MDDGCEEYIRQVLEAYRKTPGTMGTVRRADRMLAAQLYQRGVAVSVIENAFVLAAARRLMRPADAPPLGTIRSLAYFLPVIEEVLDMRVSPEYFQYLRHKLQRIVPIGSCRVLASLPAPLARMMETPTPHAFGVDNTACPLSLPKNTPSAWMIAL